MTTNDSPSAMQPPSNTDVLKVVTELCNTLDELMLLHDLYYQAAESLFSEDNGTDRPVYRVLSVFPEWLRQRDTEVLATMHQLQEGLRTQP